MKDAHLDKIEPGDSAAVEDLPVVGGYLLQLQHLHIIQYSTAIDLFFWENVRGSLEYRCKSDSKTLYQISYSIFWAVACKFGLKVSKFGKIWI